MCLRQSAQREHPEWAGESECCKPCVAHYRRLLKERLTREELLREQSRRWPHRLKLMISRMRVGFLKIVVKAKVERNQTMKRWNLFILLAGAILIGTAFAGCSANLSKSGASGTKTVTSATGTQASNRVGTAVGDTAPDFQLAGLDGSQVASADLRGQPAVLIFWTAWCPACKEEAPKFNQLAARYEAQGVRVVGINIQDSLARTEGGVKDFGIRYKVVRDADASVTHRYKVTGTPTVIFLDREGRVRYFGHELPADYAAQLDALVTQQG